MAEPTKQPPEPVAVTTPTGKTGFLPSQYADAAGTVGVRRATDTEIRTEQLKANEEATAEALRKKFEDGDALSTIEGKYAPQAAGMLRGLSLGTSDEAILRAADFLAGPEGRESVRQRLLDYKEYAPLRSTAGEIGGVALGALAGDEMALGGAPGAVGRLGAAAETAIAGRLGGGALARGAGMVARGGLEGAAFGAGDAISEASLGNHDLTAEALVGGAAHGALGGMLAAGAIGAVGKGLSGLRPPRGAVAAGFDELAAKTYGEAAPGVGKALAEEAEAGANTVYRSMERAPSPAAAASDGIIYKQQHADVWANRAKVFGKHADTVENATRNFSQALDDALAAGRKADMASFGEAKVNQMSKLVDQEKFVEQANAAIAWMTDAHGTVRKLSSDATAGMGPTARKKWDGYMQKIADAIESGESVQLHTALDNTKRFVGQEAQFGKGPFGLSTTAREFDNLYQGESGLKSLLESDVWGEKAAAAQRNINGATHMMLSEGKLFTRKFTTEFGSDAGRPLYTADTSAVSGFMNRLTSAANDLDARGVESWIQARKHFLNAIEKSYTFEGEAAAAIAKEREALGKLDGVYRQTTKDVTLANQVKAALQEERERGIGGAIGAVLDIANKPYTTMQRLAQIEAHTKGVLEKISGGTRELVGVGEKAATEATPKLKPAASGQSFFSALFDGVGKIAPATGGAGTRALFHKRVDEIGTMQGNPALVADRVSRSLEPLGGAAPNVVTAATGIALRGIDFLASKLPPSRLDPFSLQPQLQPRNRASDAEISQFMRYTQAIDDPLIVLRDAKAGTLTRDHVEAVKAVYPQLYDQMRVEVMRSVVQTTAELPYAKRIQLGILLDIPTDKTLAPDFLREIQATYSGAEKAGAESPPPNIAPPDIAGSAQTATQMAVERAA